MVQETIEGIASNKELHEQLQQIMKEQSNVNRTPQQIETKLRAPRCLNNIPLVSGHSVLARPPSLDVSLVDSVVPGGIDAVDCVFLQPLYGVNGPD